MFNKTEQSKSQISTPRSGHETMPHKHYTDLDDA